MTVHSMYNSVITTCVLGTDLLGVLRKCWDRVSLCNLDLVRTFLKTQIGFKFSSLLPRPPECWGYRPAHPRPRVSQIVGISERLVEEMLATPAVLLVGVSLKGTLGPKCPFLPSFLLHDPGSFALAQASHHAVFSTTDPQRRESLTEDCCL